MSRQQVIRAVALPASSRLAIAISEFEADLSIEQKVRTHQIKTHAPSVDDIVRLTAEIDQAQNATSGRCYGPRFHTFLQGLQEFASIGDVMVGGSQNLIACGVWSIVRISLLAITKSAPFAEKLSNLFMSLGRMTPRFQDVAALFVHSKPIQDSIFEYYIIVVRLCHEILRLSKKSTFGAILSNFGYTLDSYTADLNRKVESIKLELQLESIKETSNTNKKNNLVQTLSVRNIQLQKISRQQAFKQRILDACSTHDYQTTWKQTAKSGKTSLFVQEETYLDWTQRNTSCTLVYSGKLGSGKSVLLANLVSALCLDGKANVAYFFCRYDSRDSLHPRTIIGCLARQVLIRHANLDFLYERTTLDLKSKSFDIDELLDLIRYSVSGPVYFVLDGLDECTTEDRRAVMQCLERLQEVIRLLLCIATRFPADSSQEIDAQSRQKQLHATMPAINPDVEIYVQMEIDDRLATGDLRVSDEGLIPEIKERLIEDSQGMFLWVYLQIRSLCMLESDHAIREALRNLPLDLADTYTRILQLHGKANYQRNALELILAALRPLTTEELREALSVEPGNTEYDPTKLINSIDRILRSCGGLIIIDEEENTTRLVHSSTRQFLTTILEGPIDPSVANGKLLEIVLTYLNYALLETQISRKVNIIPSASIPAAILINKFPMARKFVKPSQSRRIDETMANTAISSGGGQSQPRTEFQRYAHAYWARHIVLFEANSNHLRLLRSALTKGRLDIHAVGPDGLTPLQLAAHRGCLTVVEILLAYSPEQQDKQKAAILGALSQANEVVLLLVDRMDTSLKLDDLLFEALAIESGVLAGCLVETGRISKKPKNKRGKNPGEFAVKHNKVQMVRLLLDAGLVDPYECTYLVKSAIIHDFLEIVQELSECPMVRTAYVDRSAREALWSLIFVFNNNSNSILNVLLENNIISNQDICSGLNNMDPRTPLMMAAEQGRADIVKLLLARPDVNVNAMFHSDQKIEPGLTMSGSTRTAMSLASSHEVRELLREAGGRMAGDGD